MYRRIRPCSRLLPFVESFWIQEHFEPPFGCDQTTRILPAGKMDFVFHYGDPFVDVTDGKREILPRMQIAGQRSRPIDVRASGRTGIVIASLYPWGAAAFLPGSMTSLSDRLTDLEDILNPASVRRLGERLAEGRTDEARARHVESFLLGALDDARRDEIVIAATTRLRDSAGAARVAELAREQSFSRRQWMRRFQACVGLSPKKFARVMRFQKATALKSADWIGARFASAAATTTRHTSSRNLEPSPVARSTTSSRGRLG